MKSLGCQTPCSAYRLAGKWALRLAAEIERFAGGGGRQGLHRAERWCKTVADGDAFAQTLEWTMRTFSPAEVEEYTGWTTQSLRDLRNKKHLTKSGVPINYGDLLSNYGELQPNGRWTYSLRDLVAFWVARALNENYQDPFASFLPGVFAVSYTNAERVIGFAKGQPPREGWTVILHLLTPNKFGGLGGSLVNLPRIQDLENNPDPNIDLSFHRADVFNWKHFADTMPAALKSLVLEA